MVYIPRKIRDVMSRRIPVHDDSERTVNQSTRNSLSSAGMLPTPNDLRAGYVIGACCNVSIIASKF